MTSSRACRYHPDREGTLYCQKYDRYFCHDCIQCREPTQYCKYRTACLIWELERHGFPKDDEDAPTEVSSELPIGRDPGQT